MKCKYCKTEVNFWDWLPFRGCCYSCYEETVIKPETLKLKEQIKNQALASKKYWSEK